MNNHFLIYFTSHDVAEVGGVAAFSIGEEDIDRRVIIYKKEFAPSDEELAALRRGEEWDPEKAKLEALQVFNKIGFFFISVQRVKNICFYVLTYREKES